MLAEYLGQEWSRVATGSSLTPWHLTTVTDLLDIESLLQRTLICRDSGIGQRFLGAL